MKVTRVAGWTAFVMTTAIAAGGAASSPEGIQIGIPGPALVGVVILALGLLAYCVRDSPWHVGLAFGPLLVLLFVGSRLPGVAALSGPPLFALVLAALVLVLAQSPPPFPRRAFFPLVLLLYLAIALRVQSQVGPEGDEPQYLMVTDSILRDHSLSPEKAFAQGRYRVFHAGPLEPHYRVRGRHGEIYSLHSVGLSVLLLPAYGLGGYAGASYFMALLAALVAWETREAVFSWTSRLALADGVGWMVALSPPLIHYAGLIFTEVPAALIVALVLSRGGRTGRKGLLALGIAVAALPWLNVRYVVVEAVLLVYLVFRIGARSRALLALPVAASCVGIAVYHFLLYGFFDPRHVYGLHPELALSNVPEGLQGLWLDQEFGLLCYAPVFALGLPGLLSLKGSCRLTALGLVGGVVLTASAWPMWRGGFNPPARFLLPALPALALAVAAWLRPGLRAGGALLIGWSLWTGLSGGLEPRLVHRDREGTAPLFRDLSGAEEWTRLLPRYVLSEPDRHRLAVVWSVALALAGSRWPALGPARGLTVAVAGFAAATGLASTLAESRTGGRDAVRLVGRACFELPRWRFRHSASARWGPEVLDLGPLYEPHRHPAGAVVGSRLGLPQGRYRFELEAETLSTRPPILEVRPWRGEVRRMELQREGPWAAEFEVREGEKETTLVLCEGGPLLLRWIGLQALKETSMAPDSGSRVSIPG